MQGDKENQEIGVVGRLISLEALLALMGVVSLVSGLIAGVVVNIVTGSLILVAAIVLARNCRRMHPKKRTTKGD
jgi:Flp pilus assembly protein TadB